MDPHTARVVFSDLRSTERLDEIVRAAIASGPEGVSSESVVRSIRLQSGAKSAEFDVYAALYKLHARGDVRFGRDRRWRARTSPPDEWTQTKGGHARYGSPATRRRTLRSGVGWLWTDTGERREGVQSAVCVQISTLEKRSYRRSIAVFVRTSAAKELLRDRVGETGNLDISWRTFVETEGKWELAIIGIGLPGDQEPGAGPEARAQGRSLDEIERRTGTLVHCVGDRRVAEASSDRRLARLARLGTPPVRTQAPNVSQIESGVERDVYEGLKARGIDVQPQWEILGYRLDFALFDQHGDDLLALDVEVDGRYWHTDAKGTKRTRDVRRDECLEAAGWKVLRLWDDEIRNDLEKCLDRIERAIERR